MKGIVAIGHVGIGARDMDALADFYAAVVGLRKTVHHKGIVAIFEVGDADFFVMPGDPKELEFDFAADDVDAMRAKLVAAGVACSEAKDSKVTGHRSFRFTDPEGNEVSVTSAHPRSSRG